MAGTTADKLELLADNKTAIKAAINAKSPTTAPTDVMSQWPTAIASIPTGVVRPVYNATLAAQGTKFKVKIPAANYEYGINNIVKASASASFTVNWGDGSTDTYTTNKSSFSATHTYADAGEYTIIVSDDATRVQLGCYNSYQVGSETALRNYRYISCVKSLVLVGSKITSMEEMCRECTSLESIECGFPPAVTTMRACFCGCHSLASSYPEWPDNVSTVTECYSECYSLQGTVVPWNSLITDANSVYNKCYSLTGSVPAWNSAITNAYSTYYCCSGLTGSVPAWNSAITNAYRTYYYCDNLSGSVPAWNNVVTTARQCYAHCKISGAIPAWGSAMTDVYEIYCDCAFLDDVWRVDGAIPSDTELMPSSITTHGAAVNRANLTLRGFFLTEWGGTRAS